MLLVLTCLTGQVSSSVFVFKESEKEIKCGMVASPHGKSSRDLRQVSAGCKASFWCVLLQLFQGTSSFQSIMRLGKRNSSVFIYSYFGWWFLPFCPKRSMEMVLFNPNFPIFFFYFQIKRLFLTKNQFISTGHNCTASVLAYLVHCCSLGSVLKSVTSCRAMWFGVY